MKKESQKNYCVLYLLRHGETDWNAKNLIQGQSDIPLNKNGKRQAKLLAKKFKKIKLTAVFSSDLVRAEKTAKIIAAEHNLPVITNKALRERDFGDLEGKPSQWLDVWRKKIEKGSGSLTNQEKKLLEKIKIPMESNNKLMRRFVSFLKEIALAYPQKNVLIVTHGSVLRTFLIKLGFFKNEKDSFTHRVKNGAYVKILSDGEKIFLKEIFGIEKILYHHFNQNKKKIRQE